MQITLTIRPATANDFKTNTGITKFGVMYFEKSITGAIQPFPCYLDDDTNLEQFKILFNKNQIFDATGALK